jgi:predicted CXXCH cytochrome family protein
MAPRHLALAAALAGLAATAAGQAAPGRSLAPIPESEALSTHGPFEMGDCGACHLGRKGSAKPGRLLRAVPALCFDCHEEFKGKVEGHPVSKRSCTACHSPHNARKPKLLL